MTDATLRPTIDTSGFATGTQQIQQQLNQIKGSVANAGNSFSQFARQAASIAGVALSLHKIVEEASAAEKNIVTLTSLLKAQGLAAERVLPAIQNLSKALSSRTAFSASAFDSASASLIRMGVASDKTLKSILEVSAGLATASDRFGGLEGAATALGRALQRPGENMRALAVAGFSVGSATENAAKKLAEAGKTVQATNLLLDALRAKLGGVADDYVKTLPGAISQAKNAFADFAEGIGRQKNTNSSMVSFFQELKENIEESRDLAKGLGDALSGAFELATAALKPFFEIMKFVGQGLSQIYALVKTLGAAFSENLPQVLSFAKGVKDAIVDFSESVLKKIFGFVPTLGELVKGAINLVATLFAGTLSFIVKIAEKASNAYIDFMNLVQGGRLGHVDFKLDDDLDAFTKKWLDMADTFQKADPAIKEATGSLEGLKDTIKDTALTSEELATIKKAMLTGSQLVGQLDDLKAENEAVLQGKDAYERYKKTLDAVNDTKQFEQKLREAVKDGYQLDEKQINQMVTSYGKLKKTIAENTTIMEENQKQVDQLKAVYENAAQNIQDAFSQMFQNIFTTGDFSFKSLFTNIKAAFIKMVAEMASVQLFQGLGGSIFSGLTGSSGRAGPGLTAAGLPISPTSNFGSSSGSTGISGIFDSLTRAGGKIFNTADTISLGGLFNSYQTLTNIAPGTIAQPGMILNGTKLTAPTAVGPGSTLQAPLNGSLGVSFSQAASLAGLGFSAFQFAQQPSISSGFGLGGAALGALGAFGAINPVVGIVGAIALPLIGSLFGGGAAKKRAEADRRAVERQNNVIQLTDQIGQFVSAYGSDSSETETGKALRELEQNFYSLKSAAEQLKISTVNLETAFKNAKKRITEDFNDSVTSAILQYENPTLAQYNKLKDAQQDRINEAIDAEGDLAAVRKLNALELKDFFSQLNATQLQAIGQEVSALDLFKAKLNDLFSGLGGYLNQALQMTSNAYETAKAATQLFANASAQLQQAINDIQGSDLTTLAPYQVLDQRRSQFQDLYARAQAGDTTAIGQLSQSGNALLQISRSNYASAAPYTQDYNMVLQALSDIQGRTGTAAAVSGYQTDLYGAQGRLLESIQNNLGSTSPDNMLLKEQNAVLKSVQNYIKIAADEQKTGNAISDLLNYIQDNALDVSENILKVLRGDSGADSLTNSIQSLVDKLNEYLDFLKKEEQATAADKAYQAQLDAYNAQIDEITGGVRGKASSAVAALAAGRKASVTSNNQVWGEFVDISTGKIINSGGDRGDSEKDRVALLHNSVVPLLQYLQQATGGTLDPTLQLVAGTKYGSGFKWYGQDFNDQFAINDYTGIVQAILTMAQDKIQIADPDLAAFVKGLNFTDIVGAFTKLSQHIAEQQVGPKPTAPVPGFAFGGDFTVMGNGGTDSQIVMFRATPGEKVSVKPFAAVKGGEQSSAMVAAMIAEIQLLRTEVKNITRAMDRQKIATMAVREAA